MRYPYKYAMPVDPRVLQEDFESDGLDSIAEIVAMLKKIKQPSKAYSRFTYDISEALDELFFAVNQKSGINLRDREKLLPIFEEYARLSQDYIERAHTLYRGLYIPSSLGTPLTDEYGEDAKGILPVRRGNVKKILESLAYGLRSWSRDRSMSEQYAEEGPENSDKVLFRCLSHQPSSFILDGNAVKKMDKANNMHLHIFDTDECVLFLKRPKILNIFKEELFWVVTIEE